MFKPPVTRPAPPVKPPAAAQRPFTPPPTAVIQRAAARPLAPPAWKQAPAVIQAASSFGGIKKVDNKPATGTHHASGHVYGIGKKLTMGQAKGTTGGAQTTYMDCTINGFFFGKFTNKLDDHFKENKGIKDKSLQEVQTIKLARWAGYPTYCVKPDGWNTNNWNEGASHAEDLLIIALVTGHHALATRGTPVHGKAPLLSIRINNTPCERCAANLIRVCSKLGISLRVKGSYLYEAQAQDSGTKILTNAGVPVRQWRTARIDVKSTGTSAGKRRNSVTESTWFTTARNNTPVQDQSWEQNYKRANLDNSASITNYARDTLMMD